MSAVAPVVSAAVCRSALVLLCQVATYAWLVEAAAAAVATYMYLAVRAPQLAPRVVACRYAVVLAVLWRWAQRLAAQVAA